MVPTWPETPHRFGRASCTAVGKPSNRTRCSLFSLCNQGPCAGVPPWFSPTCSFGASSLLVRIGAEADMDLWVLTENFGAQELLCCASLRAFVSLGNPTRTKPNVGPGSPPLRTEWYVMCTSGILRTEWYVTCNSCFRKRPVLEKLDGQCLSRRPIAAKSRVQIHCSEQNDFLGPTGVLVGTRAGALLVHHASAAFQKP